MPSTVIPVKIKPHLIPFLFKELKMEEITHEGEKVKAVKVDNYTYFGRFIRLLIEKSSKKIKCDEPPQILFIIANDPRLSAFMNKDYVSADGRGAFLCLPKSGEQLINEYLQQKFDIACMFFIFSRHQTGAEDPLNKIIEDFLVQYNLEEFDYDISAVRRDYYRKLKSGYFSSKVNFNTLTNRIE